MIPPLVTGLALIAVGLRLARYAGRHRRRPRQPKMWVATKAQHPSNPNFKPRVLVVPLDDRRNQDAVVIPISKGMIGNARNN